MSAPHEDIIESVQGVEDSCDSQPYMLIGVDDVEEIRREEESLGDYGIAWYRSYDADGRALAQINARHAEMVTYVKQPKPD